MDESEGDWLSIIPVQIEANNIGAVRALILFMQYDNRSLASYYSSC